MTRKGRRLVILVAGLVVLLGAGAAVALAAGRTGDNTSHGSAGVQTTTAPAAPTTAASSSADESVDPSPSVTPAGSSSPSPTAGSTGTGTPSVAGRVVRVALGYADWDAAGQQVEAAGFVTDAVQSGGVCTLTLTKAAVTVTATRTAQADATTTNCGALTVPASRLSAGTWQATLSYRSDTAHGTSAPMNVVVPAR